MRGEHTFQAFNLHLIKEKWSEVGWGRGEIERAKATGERESVRERVREREQ